MSVPQISLRAADIVTGEAPEVPEADTSTLFTNLKLKFPEDARFLASHVGFDDNDLEWEGVRPLGKGAFGKVGLWAAKDTQGSYVKEIAVKQCEQKENKKEDFREARIMNQLNQFQCPNILRLENFKYYPAAKRYRFYLEFCPYADVKDLWTRYREKGHYPPEQFIWHIFHGLARAAQVMAQGPFNDLKTNQPTTQRILHLDIKPANVFLGYKADDSLFKSYPVVKLGDFGVARLSGPSDRKNPWYLYLVGSAAYKPPEHRPTWSTIDEETGERRDVEKFAGWADPPVIMGRTKLEPRSNIWPIGLVIFMLTTLHSAREWCRYADVVEEEVFIELDGHVIPRIVTDRRPEYSEELRNLVRECLNPRIGSRPTASDLVTRTQAGMERYRTTLNGRNATRAPTLRHLTKSKSVLPEKRASRWHQPVSGVTASAPPPAPVLLATAVPTAPALGAGEGEGEREGEAAYQGAGEEPIAGLYRGAGAGGIAGADAVFSSSGETSDEPRRAGAGGVAGADAVFSSSGEIGDESLGPTWEPFSGAEKGRPSGSRASPIKSRSNRDVLPPKVPPHLKNGRGGKRRRDGTGGQSVSSKRSKSTNSAGEVIVISSDISSANAPATAAAPPPTPTADKDPDHSNVLQEDVVAPDVIVISSDTSASNAPPIDKTRANHNIARQANGNGGSSRSPSKPRSARDRSRSRVRKKSNRTGNSRDSSADEEGSDEQRYEEEDEDGADEEADSDGDRDDSSEAYEAKAKYDDSKDKTYNPYEDNQDEDSMEYKSRLRPRRRRQRRR